VTGIPRWEGAGRGQLVTGTAGRPPTHGLSKHPLYPTWQSMMARCENPAHRAWPFYGGRADSPPVTVCAEWRDPARFIADILAEIGPRPEGRTPGGRTAYTLNRKNNDGPYAAGNVEWADWETQNRNARDYGLSPAQRVARAQRAVQMRSKGLSYPRIGATLGISAETARGIVRRARVTR
jgi:DNA-binding CsgD family transcriptional regulator